MSAPQRKRPLPCPEKLRGIFFYKMGTGEIRAKTDNSRKDRKTQSGYRNVDFTLDGQRYSERAHRMAFALLKRRWPMMINHKNRQKDDNRWENLEETTNKENVQHAWDTRETAAALSRKMRLKKLPNNPPRTSLHALARLKGETMQETGTALNLCAETIQKQENWALDLRSNPHDPETASKITAALADQLERIDISKMRTNRSPKDIWETLRRLLDCNKEQLAARLGVTPKTLRGWENLTAKGEPITDNARRAAAELLTATLRAAGQADDMLRARERSK